MPPRRANKTKAQRAFEQEKARVGQILFERGEVPPPKDVFDEAWLRQWNADEALLARKPEILQILLGRGEAPPTGGMTIPWLQTWDAAEDARVKAEAKREEHARYNAKRKASPERDNRLREAKNAKRCAQRATDGRTQHAAAQPVVAQPTVDEDVQVMKAGFLRVAKLEAEYAMFCGTKAYRDDVSDSDDGPLLDDLSDNEESFPEALHSMPRQATARDLAHDLAEDLEHELEHSQMFEHPGSHQACHVPHQLLEEVLEELGPPQKKQKTEGQQSSVKGPTKAVPVIRSRIYGWRKKGNARKARAQDRAAKLFAGDDAAIFEESGIGLEDNDRSLNEEEKKATVHKLPPRFKMSSDPRLGDPAVDTAAGVDAKGAERFDETARKIIRFLKATAKEYNDMPKHTKRTTWQPMVRGMLMLLRNASEEYLLECLMSGISDSVRSTLGKPDFTIDDLVNLPGGSVDQNIEKGIYLDVLHLLHGTNEIRQLYVGAAAGKFGLAQRWHQYLTRQVRHESGIHSKELMKEGSTVCLRALARYGHTPYPWLLCFAETFFMLYLGTIEDPGHRADPGHHTEAFLNDVLYKNVKKCRLSAGLAPRLAVGLNSTWSLSQGYSWAAWSNSACNNCKRKVVPRKDPRWEHDTFVSCDAERPGESVTCVNCLSYRKKSGVDRPLKCEDRLVFRKTAPIPQICQGPRCNRPLMDWNEMDDYFVECIEAKELVTEQCPVTRKWVPRVFQHDKVHFGNYHWVCFRCSADKMGYAYQLSGQRVNYG